MNLDNIADVLTSNIRPVKTIILNFILMIKYINVIYVNKLFINYLIILNCLTRKCFFFLVVKSHCSKYIQIL